MASSRCFRETLSIFFMSLLGTSRRHRTVTEVGLDCDIITIFTFFFVSDISHNHTLNIHKRVWLIVHPAFVIYTLNIPEVPGVFCFFSSNDLAPSSYSSEITRDSKPFILRVIDYKSAVPFEREEFFK